MTDIVPAILTADETDFKEKLARVETFAPRVQIDVADGVFVPNTTLDPTALAPFETKLKIEIHLMVAHPEEFILRCDRLPLPLSAHTVAFHLEAADDARALIAAIREKGCVPGIAVNPETDWRTVEPFLPDIGLVLFLSVHPGFQGKGFVPETIGRIKAFRSKWPNVPVGVDGGIKRGTVPQVAALGVREIVVGSAIWNADVPEEEYRSLVLGAGAADE